MKIWEGRLGGLPPDSICALSVWGLVLACFLVRGWLCSFWPHEMGDQPQKKEVWGSRFLTRRLKVFSFPLGAQVNIGGSLFLCWSPLCECILSRSSSYRDCTSQGSLVHVCVLNTCMCIHVCVFWPTAHLSFHTPEGLYNSESHCWA